MTRQRRKRTLHCTPSYLGVVVKLIEARLKIAISCEVIDDLTTSLKAASFLPLPSLHPHSFGLSTTGSKA